VMRSRESRQIAERERERERERGRGNAAREAPEIPTSSAASRIPLFGLRFAREKRIRNDVLEGRESFSTRCRLVVPAMETSGMREPVVSDGPEEWDPPRAPTPAGGDKTGPDGASTSRGYCRVGHRR